MVLSKPHRVPRLVEPHPARPAGFGHYSGPSQEGAASPHITLPGPGSYIAHMTAAGQVTCLLASEEEAAVRIYFAEGSLMCHRLKSIRAHWSIVQQSRVFEDGPKSSLGEEGLGRAIAEGDRLATAFLPLWDFSPRSQA